MNSSRLLWFFFNSWKNTIVFYLRRDSLSFLFFISSFFLICWNVYSREFWRDEIQAWLIARDSSTYKLLIANISYEGKPPGWFSFLYVVAKLDPSLSTFTITYLLLVLTSLVFLFSSRLPLAAKIATFLGFYFAYGYTSMAREYVLLLVLLSAWLWNICRENPFGLRFNFLIFSLLSTVNLFGCITALSFYVSSFFLYLKGQASEKRRWQIVLLFIGAIWAILMIVISFPSENHLFRQNRPFLGLETRPNFLFWKSVGFFAQISFPFNEVYVVGHATLLPSFVGLIVVIYLISKVPMNQRLFIALTITGLFLFHIFAYSPFWWHRGIAVILITYGSLIIIRQDAMVLKRKLRSVVIASFFLFQILGSLYGLGRDFHSNQPYSNAKNAAKHIAALCEQEKVCTLVSDNDMYSSAILGYLPGQSIFYVNRDEFGTFALWKSDDGSKTMYPDWRTLESKLEEFINPIFITTNTGIRPTSSKYQTILLDNSVTGDDYLLVFRNLGPN